MTYISGKCPYCKNSKTITADKTSWSIHMASHREEIVKQLTDVTQSCVLCAYSEIFANKKHAASHYRWSHKKSHLVDWELKKISRVLIA